MSVNINKIENYLNRTFELIQFDNEEISFFANELYTNVLIASATTFTEGLSALTPTHLHFINSEVWLEEPLNVSYDEGLARTSANHFKRRFSEFYSQN